MRVEDFDLASCCTTALDPRVGGDQGDLEDAGFAYVTRHRANTLDRVPLAPRHGSEVRHIAGDPFTPLLAGPSSLAWGRSAGDHGRVAYVTTDGGVTAPPPDGIIRKSALLRAELHPAKENS